MAFSFKPHPAIKPPAKAGKATAEYLKYNLARFQVTVRHLKILGAASLPMWGLYPEQGVLASYHLSLWLKGEDAIAETAAMQAIVMQHLAHPQRLLPLRAFPTSAMAKKRGRLTDACATELGINLGPDREEEIKKALGIQGAHYQDLRPVTMSECLLAAIELGNPLLGALVCGHYEQIYFHRVSNDEESITREEVNRVAPGLYERLGVPSEAEWYAHARDFVTSDITPARAMERVRGK